MTKIEVDLQSDDTLVVKSSKNEQPKVTKIEVRDAQNDAPSTAAEFLAGPDETWAERLQGEGTEKPAEPQYDIEIVEDGSTKKQDEEENLAKNVDKGSTEDEDDTAWEYEASPHRGMKIFSRICFFLFLISLLALAGTLLCTSLLPVNYMLFFGGGGLFFLIIFALIVFRKKPLPVLRFFTSLCELIVAVVCALPTVYLLTTLDFVQAIQAKGYQTEKYELLVLKDSGLTSPENLTGKKNGIYVDTLANYDSALAQFGTTVNSEPVLQDNFLDAAKALVNKEVDFMLLNVAYKPLVSDLIGGFKDKTQSLTSFETKKYPNYNFENVNPAKSSFNILVTGVDTFGEASELARNDFVTIVSVNPSTQKILITSVPPNLYLNIDPLVESKDKISNAGIYGIDTTAAALENLLGIKFNYYLRTNFNTLKNLVDAVDGVDVYSEAYAVANDNSVPYSCTFPQNKEVHLNGICAVAFARERESYVNGEVQRLKNQVELSERLTAKLTSLESTLYYLRILATTRDSIETNISQETFSEFIKFNISELPNWQVETQELSGEPKIATLYSLNSYVASSENSDYFFVLEPTSKSLEAEKAKFRF